MWQHKFMILARETMWIMKIAFIALFTFIALELNAQMPVKWGVDENQRVPVGLSKGDQAPNFEAIDTEGNQVNLKELRKQGKVVLLFYRGQWCPVCNRYLSGFQDSLQFIFDKKASVIAVTPETTSNANIMIEKTGMTFSVISDSEGDIMKQYDVLFEVTEEYQNTIINNLHSNIAENNGADAALLPIPATYIIGQDGVIEEVFFDYNYKIRASVKDIVEKL